MEKEIKQSSAFSLTDFRVPHAAGQEEKPLSIDVPAISLPKGGGAVKSIEEKFSVNAANGTSSFSVPLPVSPSRALTPELSLSYNSGSGNGAFGLGWTIDVPFIARQTDKKIPVYNDVLQPDDFMISGAEELVPVLQPDGEEWKPVVYNRTENGTVYTVAAYRPRIDVQFSRIEKWVNDSTGDAHWRTTTKDNVLSVYGNNAQSRIADPADSRKIFKWLLSCTVDDKGNLVLYEYKQEDFAAVENRIFEKNKIGNCTNTYLSKIWYGNKTPYHITDALLSDADFMFRLVFDYGEYDSAGIGFTNDIDSSIPADIHLEKNTWHYRQDAFSSFRAGFEIRTYRLCRRVFLFHCFEELRPEPCLIKSTEFEYADQLQLTGSNDTLPAFSQLTRIVQKGHKWDADAQQYFSRALPPSDFSYQQHQWNSLIQKVDDDTLPQVPINSEGKFYQWIDLFNEGIAGVLTEQAHGWYYQSNMGDGELMPPKLVSPKPSFTGLNTGELTIRELEANGKKYVVSFADGLKGFFGLKDEITGDWEPFKNFDAVPALNFNDPNLRWVDLNGDGMPDLLLSEDDVFVFYPAKGEKGFEAAAIIRKTNDEEKGPAILFSDSTQSIYLADMTGQGLTDIVRIRNGEVCYWANVGYGRFSAKVTMEYAPVFDSPDAFHPKYIRLADIDGSGTTDIIYLGKNEFRMWSNLSGNAWTEQPKIINPFPEIHHAADIQVFDFLGNGTACIVWVSPLPADSNYPLQYIDLMNGSKPFLLQTVSNNIGKQVTLHYRSSTSFYLEDKKAGTPWITHLPFPVHVLVKTETSDVVTGAKFTNEYTYHHGYYDQQEREFRGFGRVDQRDTETYTQFARDGSSNIVDAGLHQPPVLTRTWFHTGAAINRAGILSQLSGDYYQNEQFAEYHLPDAAIELPGTMQLKQLSDAEYGEVFRACKTMLLRQEVYAEDETTDTVHPYTVKEQNCRIRMLQPKAGNQHAVFTIANSETITYNYERNPYDPRVAHDINIALDEYNDVLKKAAIVYSRWINNPAFPPDIKNEIAQLPQKLKDAQTALHIIYTENSYTADVIAGADYRLRLPAETSIYELTGAQPQQNYFSLEEMTGYVQQATALAYGEIPDAATVQKRLMERLRTLYMDALLSGPLPLGQLSGAAITYEAYKLSYTTSLIDDLFNDKVDEALLKEAGFRKSGELKPLFPAGDADDDWWQPSGTMGYPANPAAHFFLPQQYINPFGNSTTAAYETKYHLFVPQTEDAIGSQTAILQYNFRTLLPQAVKDCNDNITEVRFDIAGKVAGTAIRGKGNEADDFDGFAEDLDKATLDAFFTNPAANGANLLQHATTRIIYDYSTLPVSAATIVREQHHQQTLATGTPAKLQYSFEYSGGLGQVVMKKIQAEPGLAKSINENGVLIETDTTPGIRWIGNGRTVFNNKGKPVKQYEPYFSLTHAYEWDNRLVEIGVTSVFYYDPLGRNIRTQFANSTYTKILFDTWKEVMYDNNDTVADTDWYNNRINRLIDAQLIAEGKDPDKEQEAAAKAFKHSNTPQQAHLDSLGRKVLLLSHNKDSEDADEMLSTFFALDIKGNLLTVFNALDNISFSYKYDIQGNQTVQQSIEGGGRTLFADAAGNIRKQWNSRAFLYQYAYDALLRPISIVVQGGDDALPLNHTVRKMIYGEEQPDDKINNLRGKVFQSLDQAGIKTTAIYDFKNNPLMLTQQFCSEYKEVINWDAVQVSPEAEIYTSNISYDAINRIIKTTLPHVNNQQPSAQEVMYNERSLLQQTNVAIAGAVAQPFVTGVDYNEKGQRTQIRYGNNTRTSYWYDPFTFCLISLRTTRPAGLNGVSAGIFKDASIIQDCHYTFDPVLNITDITDDALATPFFDGEQSNATSSYEYDALYRLISASGRKQAGQTDIAFTRADFNYSNQPFINSGTISPNDANAFRNYREQYTYDKLGNMTAQQHIAKNSNWTRTFNYALNNQLMQTTVGAFTASYTYDVHGNMEQMEHLQAMTWDYSDALHEVNLGGGGTAWYVYNAEGQRVRKIIERQDGSKKERLYIGNTEVYRERNSGNNITWERITVKVTDDKKHIAFVDTPTVKPAGSNELQLIRYQYSNHLESAALELDDEAKTISYEEYFPFGATSFSLTDNSREIPARRYRFTAKERDEESGLNYHGARYYAPWLCRWTAADKVQRQEMDNRYVYVKNNPIIYIDNTGLFEELGHGALTYRLALAAGFNEQDAAQIALATAGMDHDPATRPGDSKPEMALHIFTGVTREYHFPDQDVALGRVEGDINGSSPINLTSFGRHLHSLEDVGFVDAPGPHDRTEERALSELAGFLGLTGLGLGAAAFFGGLEGTKSSSTGWKILGGIAIGIGVLLLGAGALFMVFGIFAAGIGHPTYITQIGQESSSFKHTADEAYQDPSALRNEYNRIFPLLQRAAAARYGHPVTPDYAAANQAITEAGASVDRAATPAGEAATRELVLGYFDKEPGNGAHSYAYWVARQGECSQPVFKDITRWTRSRIDISVNDHDVHYRVQQAAVCH